MEITTKHVQSILTPQHTGFLAAGPYPFTHALSGYIGCGFGQTTCGLYCYAQYLPNWHFRGFAATWGQAVQVKENAAELLEQTLHHMRPETRKGLRIFMSSTTDPYQPAEHTYKVTQQCLQVFARYPDLDLLVIQTRGPLAERDLPLMQQIPYVWLSVTIETNDQGYLKQLKGGPVLQKRWELVRNASLAGVPTQITVSPCLPYSNVEQFGQLLLNSGARRIVVDTVIDGDGSHGKRTEHSPFAATEPAWAQTDAAHQLYTHLQTHAATNAIQLGWSNAGFCGISPRIVNVS